MNELFDLKDKLIIITGGLGFLGYEYSNYLMQNGAKVAIFDLPNINYKPFSYSNHLLFSVDITNKDSIEIAFEMLKKKWGMPHGLINNAAIDFPPKINYGKFQDYSSNDLEEVIRVNVIGLINCCQVVGPIMARNNYGSIINIGSIYGINSPDQRIYEEGFEKPISYSASKAALLGITKYLATYWAKDNVRVNLLVLGGVFKDQSKEFVGKYSLKVPMGRMAEQSEYNGAIHFLLSDASRYMTGSNLVIDGGYTAW